MWKNKLLARLMKPFEDGGDAGGGSGGGGGFDVAAAAEQIGTDLFGSSNDDSGSGGDDPGAGGGEAGAAAPAGESGAAAPAVAATPPANPAAPAPGTGEPAPAAAAAAPTPAPRTWRPEAAAEWEKLPAAVQQEVLKREEDMFKGIEGYKADATLGKNFSQVLAPYQQLFAQTRQDPAQLTSQLFAAHAQLSLGSPEQKLATVRQIADMYGVQLAAAAPDGEEPYADPQVKALQQQLAAVQSQMSAQAQQQARIAAAEDARVRETLSREIDTFAADPANQYFNDVANDIAQLLQSGVAKDLKDAYERAIWLNPVTRAKELDRQTAEKTAKAQDEARKKAESAAAATAANVRTKAKHASGTAPGGSIDDTLKQTLATIQSRQK